VHIQRALNFQTPQISTIPQPKRGNIVEIPAIEPTKKESGNSRTFVADISSGLISNLVVFFVTVPIEKKSNDGCQL